MLESKNVAFLVFPRCCVHVEYMKTENILLLCIDYHGVCMYMIPSWLCYVGYEIINEMSMSIHISWNLMCFAKTRQC